MPDELPPPPAPEPPPFQPSPAPLPPASAPTESQVRMWNMICHLSALSGYLVPLGNVLGPLLVWQIKKNEIPSVEFHGKAALNFQLTILIAVVGGTIMSLLLMAICIGYLVFLAVMAVGLCGLIFPIIAGIKANDGKEYKYPYSFELIK